MSKMTGLAHIGIFVKSFEKSNPFYIDLLGFELFDKWHNLEFLRIGSCILELIEQPDLPAREAGPVDHIAIEVEGIDELYEKLKANNVPTLGEVGVMSELLGGVKNLFFIGPDGERLEFFEYINK